MAKILSTFSKVEQSRFEAFKRVTFPADAISKYVAHSLAERQRYQQCPDTNQQSLLAKGSKIPKLQDLVVPGQEEEITTVVATLAKVYAQRLCAAAKTHQQQQSTAKNGSANGPIQPEHVMHAYYARKDQGQDPGFFLQPNEGLAIPDNGKDQVKRVAALAAQEDLDRLLEEYNQKEKDEATESQKRTSSVKKEGGHTSMEEDSDSGDEEEVEVK